MTRRPRSENPAADLSDPAVFNRGERILESEGGKLFQEHLHRYRFAAGLVCPMDRVLDCACGTGYGCRVLARKAGQVVGIDISPTAIAYCRERNAAPNVEYLRGSAEALKLPRASVDVFVSFETIEHIPHPDRLVREAGRVLKPGGKFVVSTPNRIVSGLRSGQKPGNPFHLREWSLLEFDRVLRAVFPKVEHYGQRIRSRNPLHPVYVLSKMKRMLAIPEILPLKVDDQLLRDLESEGHWQPSSFIAVCEI